MQIEFKKRSKNQNIICPLRTKYYVLMYASGRSYYYVTLRHKPDSHVQECAWIPAESRSEMKRFTFAFGKLIKAPSLNG